MIEKPEVRLINVPLIKVDKVSIPSDTSELEAMTDTLVAAWDKHRILTLLRWVMVGSSSLTQARRLKIEATLPGLRHHLSDMHAPFSQGSRPKSRSVPEIAIMSGLCAADFRQHVVAGQLDRYLINLAEAIGISREYRNHPVGTFPDSAGAALRYPSHLKIRKQMKEITEYARVNIENDRTLPFVLMNLFFNIHPHSDGNGRMGRLLFNLTLRAQHNTSVFVPLSELSISSGGGFVLSIREAQYFNRWSPLMTYICNSMHITHLIGQEETNHASSII